MADKSPLSSPRYITPLTIFFSTAAAARTRSSHRTGNEKKNSENQSRLRAVTVCSLTFFSIKLLFFGAVTRSVISQPTDGFLLRRRNRPVLFIKTKWQRKKNGENRSIFDNF